MLHLDSAIHLSRPSASVSESDETRPGMIDDISLMLGRQFAAYTAACQAALSEKMGIALADLKALDLVLEFESLPTGQLAQLMGISPGGATALINRLEAAGYVERGRHPLDRRIIVIRPVDEQCRALLAERHAIAREVALLSRNFDTAQLETVHSFLAQCLKALRHDTRVWLETRHVHGLDD
ncbi:MarR family winged helix-turn-helix transcriptional regulator [Bordetella petrii]|uniref:MarR family winged helix-turn-helix transcriptional regulator n=1 Tax=Bordetella petrii TaxID=94624 RepID=UPI001A96EB79|nr:MarR family transcriptional regulator [Bordetella petrii]MBO1112376.1 MarR family transcriptional regulator [Bordetella petrii]